MSRGELYDEVARLTDLLFKATSIIASSDTISMQRWNEWIRQMDDVG